MYPKRIRPQHPGEYLRDELEARKISLNKLARDTHIPVSRVSAIAKSKRAISGDTALRLGRYFGMSPSMWLGFQADYELQLAMADAARIEREVIPASTSVA
jgi:addiction module HigA family antidote